MTCIVSCVNDRGDIYMAADSAGVAGDSIMRRKDPKLFIKDGFIIGFTDSFRMGQLLHHFLNIPKQEPGVDLFEYMVVVFVEELRSLFLEGGYLSKDQERDVGGTFLVGHAGRLFCIQSDFQVEETIYPYAAIGSGTDLALGSLHTTNVLKTRYNLTAEYRVRLALTAAAEFSASVASPFLMLQLPQP